MFRVVCLELGGNLFGTTQTRWLVRTGQTQKGPGTHNCTGAFAVFTAGYADKTADLQTPTRFPLHRQREPITNATQINMRSVGGRSKARCSMMEHIVKNGQRALADAEVGDVADLIVLMCEALRVHAFPEMRHSNDYLAESIVAGFERLSSAVEDLAEAVREAKK